MSIARPWLTIIVCLGLGVLAAWYTVHALTFETSAVRLLPPHRLYVQRHQQLLADFGDLDDIVVVVKAGSLARARAYADRAAAEIRALPGARRVRHRIDPDAFKGQALLYLSVDELQRLHDRMRAHRRFLAQYAEQPTIARLLDGIGHEIGRRFATGFLDLGLDGSRERLDAGFVARVLDVISHALEGDVGEAPWARMLAPDDERRSGYFVSADSRLLFILVEPAAAKASFTAQQDFLGSIRQALGTLRTQYPDVEAGATGAPALANDEMVTAFADSTRATVLAASLTMALLLVLCRRVREPLAMLLALATSLIWALALITLTVGHLTVFSVMFISLVIGIGIDYGIYLFFRYAEEVRGGRVPADALLVTAERAGPGIVFGALSAAGTFGVLMLTDFRGVQEFGFVAAIAIVVAGIAMTTFFPALLSVMQRRPPTLAVASARTQGIGGAWRLLFRCRRPVIATAATLTVASLLAVPGVEFDYNRLNLQARDNESAIWERKIIESRRSGFAALTTAESVDELRLKQAAFEKLATVSDVTTVLTLVPKEQNEKIPIIRTIASAVPQVRVAAARGDADVEATRRALAQLERWLETGVREAEGSDAAASLRAAYERARQVLARLAHDERPLLVGRLTALQRTLADDFAAELRKLHENLAPRAIGVADLPAELTRKLVAPNGRFLIMIYPAIDTWDGAGARAFTTELRTVDAGITGPPVIGYEAGRLMERAYTEGTLYALAFVTALTALLLRRPRDIMVAMIPLALGVLWTIGAMRALGLRFDLANVWALPLIVGACAEYGLNVSLRYREEAARGTPASERLPAGTVRAVLLNGLTTISGFGSLMAARHQGMFHLGALLTIGTVAGLVTSLALQPLLLLRFHRHRPGRAPSAHRRSRAA
jgi:hypothetical protein